MIIQFKNRARELTELKNILSSNNFELFILYGRRRIGKTELSLKSTKNEKRIYYLATGKNNLDRFYNVCSKQNKNINNLKKDWEILFNFLKDNVDVVIIDEFQNLINEDKNILNIFQSIVDTSLKNSKLKLFLLGSSVSIITSKVLSYKSPLYGRRTGSLNLKAVSFFDLSKFYPKKKIEELINIYGFADGIPFYLIKITNNFWYWLKQEINKQSTFLRDEIDFMLRYEFDDPSTYKLILESLSYGNTKLNEIKNFMKVTRTDISPYLRNLIEIGLIKREVPITENINSRRGRYYLTDNFLKFWFRFIYPNLSSIEEGIFDLESIKNEYNSYLGFIYEDIAKKYLIKTNKFSFTKIGKWWYKDKEVDIVGLDKNNKKIFLVECKWKHNINAKKIVNELSKKSDCIDWNNNTREEIYIVFAKSFSKKITKFNSKTVHCYELKDIKKAMN